MGFFYSQISAKYHDGSQLEKFNESVFFKNQKFTIPSKKVGFRIVKFFHLASKTSHSRRVFNNCENNSQKFPSLQTLSVRVHSHEQLIFNVVLVLPTNLIGFFFYKRKCQTPSP